MAVAIDDKNKFITEAAKLAMHALLVNSTSVNNRDPKGIAATARRYAIELWRVMRVEV
jgi:hypothetical protein